MLDDRRDHPTASGIWKNVSSWLVTPSSDTLVAGSAASGLIGGWRCARFYDTVAFDDLLAGIVSYWSGLQYDHQWKLGMAGGGR
jgi:hypothetical protein